ncbi:MAG: hypothetical protein EBS53_18760, partial [Bacteroidetes bacterium]|nr:hypothetical protein [Bacteroidota bacterium]
TQDGAPVSSMAACVSSVAASVADLDPQAVADAIDAFYKQMGITDAVINDLPIEQSFDSNGDPVLDENGDQVYEPVSILTWLTQYKIPDVVNQSIGDLSTLLADLADQLSGNSLADVITALNAEINGLQDSKANAEDVATTVQGLQDAIDTKANAEDVATAVEGLQVAIDDKAAVSALQDEIDRATAAEAGLQDAIDTKASVDDVAAAVEGLQVAIDGKVSVEDFGGLTAALGDFAGVADGMSGDGFWSQYAADSSADVLFASLGDVLAGQNAAIVDVAGTLGLGDVKSLLADTSQDSLAAVLSSLTGVGVSAPAVSGNEYSDVSALLSAVAGTSGELESLVGTCTTQDGAPVSSMAACVSSVAASVADLDPQAVADAI